MQKDFKQTQKTPKTNRMLSDDSGTREAEIAALAYELWQERGCPEGSPEIDWFRAEHELSELTLVTPLAA